MVQRRQDLRLAPEPREPIRIERERFRKDLQRDVTAQVGVSRPIHLAHSAFAYLRNDFIRADPLAEAQGHVGRSVSRRVC